MKRYKPEDVDNDTEVLAFYGEEIGYVVAKYDGENWIEAWGEGVIGDKPEHWIDLNGIDAEATD